MSVAVDRQTHIKVSSTDNTKNPCKVSSRFKFNCCKDHAEFDMITILSKTKTFFKFGEAKRLPF